MDPGPLSGGTGLGTRAGRSGGRIGEEHDIQQPYIDPGRSSQQGLTRRVTPSRPIPAAASASYRCTPGARAHMKVFTESWSWINPVKPRALTLTHWPYIYHTSIDLVIGQRDRQD